MDTASREHLKSAARSDRGLFRREQILEGAVRLFGEHGYAGTDMQILADTLQVGKGTLYRYFPSKRDLFLAAADWVMRRLRERIRSAVQGIDDPLGRVTRAIHTFLGFFAEQPSCVELLIQERAEFRDRPKPTFFEHRDTHVETWRQLYRTLIAQGRVRNVPVERITDVITDLLYGIIFTNYFTGQRKPADEQARDVIDIVFHGILRPGDGAGPESN